MAKMSQEDLRWQAESDARIMASYQEILADKARMRRAVSAAKTEASNLTKRANAMQNAAKNATFSRSTTKRK